MTDTPTTRNRFRKQETGTNNGTWGNNLNQVLDAIDQCLDGVETIDLGGAATYTLTTSNYTTSDEAKQRFLLFTNGNAAGTAVTIPSVEHWYGTVNSAGGNVTLGTAAGATLTIPNGERTIIYCDGVDVENAAPTVIDGQLKRVTAGTASTDAVNLAQMQAAIAAIATSQSGLVLNSLTSTVAKYFEDTISVAGSLVKTKRNAGTANETTEISFTFDEGNQVLLGGVLAI